MTMPTNMLPVSQGTGSISSTADPQPVQTNSVGGSGGVPFMYADPMGISTMTVVAYASDGVHPDYITQIVVYSYDGSVSKTYGGTPTYGCLPPVTVDLSSETLRSCDLYQFSSGEDGRLAGFVLEMLGQKLSFGNTGGTAVDLALNGNPNVENYYIAGVFGTEGVNIDSFGFYLVQDPIVRRIVQQFNYNLDVTPKPTPVTLNTLLVENRSSEQQSAQIAFTEEVSTTSEWSSTAGIALGTQVSITAGIPTVVEGTATTSVEATFAYSWGGSLTTTQQFNYQATVDIAPGKSASASVVVQQASLDISYTATYLIERAHSGIQTQSISGTYSGVSSYDVTVAYDDVTPPSPAST